MANLGNIKQRKGSLHMGNQNWCTYVASSGKPRKYCSICYPVREFGVVLFLSYFKYWNGKKHESNLSVGLSIVLGRIRARGGGGDKTLNLRTVITSDPRLGILPMANNFRWSLHICCFLDKSIYSS